MSWIKRNLYFVLGSLVALGLMGFGGYYLYNAISRESGISTDIEAQYTELDRLNKQNPHPGSTGKIDNVKASQEQEKQLLDFIKRAKGSFQAPPPIPDSPKVVDSDFTAQLRNTMAQLKKEAEDSSVSLPPDYYFTFESQRRLVIFQAGSLDKLAVHVGAIKAICDILFAARINALDSVRREVVSDLDDKNAQDYLMQKTLVTPLADLTPYEVSFRCFSTELASVLSGLANSPYAFIVKTINVDHTAGGTGTDALNPTGTPPPQAYERPPVAPQGEANFPNNRYGGGRYGVPPPVAVAAQPAPVRSGPTPVVNETQVRVTLMIEVVKLKTAK